MCVNNLEENLMFDEKDDRVVIYGRGLCYCSVCVDNSLSVLEIEEITNRIHPTGIPSEWRVDSKPFVDGSSNPHVCEKYPNRLHYVLSC